MQTEQDAFLEELYRKHFHELQVHAYRYLGDWQSAAEATQDAFHIAWRKIFDVMSSDNPIGWMKNTVKNTARNMVKSRAKYLSLFVSAEELPGISDVYEFEEDSSLAQECKEVLTEKKYHIFKRVAIDGATQLEVAKEMGLSLWACQKRVQRIMKILRERLGEYNK